MNTRITLHSLVFSLVSVSLFAKPVPDNLGNGLDKIVTNNLIQKGKITAVPTTQTAITDTPTKSAKTLAARMSNVTTTTAPTQAFEAYKATIAKQAASYASRAIAD